MEEHLKRFGAHLTYSNVVSTICLFILLGGGAYAATKLPRNSVGTKQLKNNAVKGAKVADKSLTAADISGPVGSASNAAEATHAANAEHASTADSATSADHAATADQAASAAELAGSPASSFFLSSRVKRADLEVEETSNGVHEHPLVTIGPLSVVLSCNKAPSSLTLGLTAFSTAPGAKIYLSFANSSPSASGEVFNFTGGETNFFTRIENSLGEAGAGVMVYRDASTSISWPFGYFVSNLFKQCAVSGALLQG
jgi:hypothetical protein